MASCHGPAVLDDLDARGVARAVLVGHSYGGGVALWAASLAPGRVARWSCSRASAWGA